MDPLDETQIALDLFSSNRNPPLRCALPSHLTRLQPRQIAIPPCAAPQRNYDSLKFQGPPDHRPPSKLHSWDAAYFLMPPFFRAAWGLPYGPV